MTDRYDAFIVILDRNLRDDDAQATLNAIRQIKGVLEVVPHIADNLMSSIENTRIRYELLRKITDILMEDQ